MTLAEIVDRAEYLAAIIDIPNVGAYAQPDRPMSAEDKMTELASLVAAIAVLLRDRSHGV